jgi:hypothetical protein
MPGRRPNGRSGRPVRSPGARQDARRRPDAGQTAQWPLWTPREVARTRLTAVAPLAGLLACGLNHRLKIRIRNSDLCR